MKEVQAEIPGLFLLEFPADSHSSAQKMHCQGEPQAGQGRAGAPWCLWRGFEGAAVTEVGMQRPRGQEQKPEPQHGCESGFQSWGL